MIRKILDELKIMVMLLFKWLFFTVAITVFIKLTYYIVRFIWNIMWKVKAIVAIVNLFIMQVILRPHLWVKNITLGAVGLGDLHLKQ